MGILLMPRPTGQGRDAPATRDRPAPALVVGVVRLALGLLLLASGLTKLAAPQAFLAAVLDYGLVGPTVAQAVTIAVPALEVVAGAALVLNRAVGGAGLIAAGLGLTFVAAQAAVLARGRSADCGCFGPLSGRVGPASLARAAAVLVAAMLVTWAAFRHRPPGDELAPPGRPD